MAQAVKGEGANIVEDRKAGGERGFDDAWRVAVDATGLEVGGGGVEEERRGGAACGHVQIMWWVVSGGRGVSESLGAALE